MENYERLEKIGQGKQSNPSSQYPCRRAKADYPSSPQERMVWFTGLETSSMTTESSH